VGGAGGCVACACSIIAMRQSEAAITEISSWHTLRMCVVHVQLVTSMAVCERGRQQTWTMPETMTEELSVWGC